MPFQPGQSGNPTGRPKENGHVKVLARAYTEAAIKALGDILADAEAPPAARATAANSLLDRAWGKPAQAVTGEDGEGPVQIMVVTGIDR